jgi:hypothetical protein
MRHYERIGGPLVLVNWRHHRESVAGKSTMDQTSPRHGAHVIDCHR